MNGPCPAVADAGRAALRAGDAAGARRALERAYAAYRSAGDQLGAIRVARTLSGMALPLAVTTRGLR